MGGKCGDSCLVTLISLVATVKLFFPFQVVLLIMYELTSFLKKNSSSCTTTIGTFHSDIP